MGATATLSSAIAAGHAWGYQYPYSVTDIRIIGFDPNVDTDGTAGINNQHEVVYAYKDGNNYVPFVYLPSSHYGFDPGTHILTLTNCNSSSAIPHDLNDSGQACGTVNFWTSTASAALWTLSAGAVSCQLLDSEISEAHALTQKDESADPPVTFVVGWRPVEGECGNSSKIYGVRWLVDDGAVNLPPVSIWAQYGLGSRAIDIPRTGSTTIVGVSAWCDTDPVCYNKYGGTTWVIGSGVTAALASLGNIHQSDAGDARNSFIYGIDPNDRMAGWIHYDPTAGQLGVCYDTAVYWPSHTSTPTDLGAIMPTGQGDDHSRAYALTTVNATKVVGENVSIHHGLRWKATQTGSQPWECDDLNALIDPNAGWTIVSAHDINDYYYIVAVATKESNGVTERHLVLLVPNISNP